MTGQQDDTGTGLRRFRGWSLVRSSVRPLARLLARPLALGEGLATALILVMMALTVIDVAGREIWSSPLAGATELIELCLVGSVFACLPVICWREENVVADLFDHLLRPAWLAALRFLGCLTGAVLFGLAAWQLRRLAERALTFNDQTAQLGISLSWPLGLMAVLTALAGLACLIRGILVLVRPDTRPGPASNV